MSGHPPTPVERYVKQIGKTRDLLIDADGYGTERGPDHDPADIWDSIMLHVREGAPW